MLLVLFRVSWFTKEFFRTRFKKAIIANLKDFILEIGKDFTFIGEEYKVKVGNHDFFIDLLFYNRELSCLVAFELKIWWVFAGVRPSFSLSSSALYSEGDGTKENPFRIENPFIEFYVNGMSIGVNENTTWEEFINSTDNRYNIDINESGNVVNSGGYEILLDGNTVSGADTIVNNGNYNTGLITFTIDEVEYQTYNGMTWEEYVDSDLNILDLILFVAYDRCFVGYNRDAVIAESNIDQVFETDEVTEGYNYIVDVIPR